MINNLKISDFKSIKNEITLDFSSDLSFNLIFGKSNAGKSVIFDAIKQFKEVFLFGMRSIGRIPDLKHTTYTLNFLIDNQQFVYKTMLNFDKSEIVYESLEFITKTTSYVYFTRNQYEIALGERLEKLFTAFDFDRFKTYLYDLKFDRREFILSHLRIKDFSESKGAIILSKLADHIKNIHIFNQNEDINFYLDMTDSHYVSVLKLIQSVQPEITGLQYKKVTLDELRFNLNRHRYDHLLDEFRNHVTKFSTPNFFVKVYDQFYKLSGRNLDELAIHSIDIHYENGLVSSFNDISSGTKKLLLLCMVLINSNPNDLIFIDDLTRDMDHESVLLWINHIRYNLDLKNIKLTFSTHNMLLLDGQHFDFKEMIYVTNNQNIKLHYLNTLGIRKDKKLLNLYLEGFFNQL